jgi:hypothetical protein
MRHQIFIDALRAQNLSCARSTSQGSAFHAAIRYHS